MRVPLVAPVRLPSPAFAQELFGNSHLAPHIREHVALDSSWTYLPIGLEIPSSVDPARDVWEKLARMPTQQELDQCAQNLVQWLYNEVKTLANPMAIFADPLYLDKPVELEDGSELRPLDKMFYVLEGDLLTAWNMQELLDYCGMEWAGGGIFGEKSTESRPRQPLLERGLYFFSAVFDNQATMVSCVRGTAVPSRVTGNGTE